jgi:hypothetical protein
MFVISLIIAVVFVGIGFFVKAFPDLISGYSTMTEEEKKHVDIDGLSLYMKKLFIYMGIVIFIGYLFFYWINWLIIANSMILIVTFLGILILSINSKKFDKKGEFYKSFKIANYILGITTVFVVALLYYGSIPTELFIYNNKIEFDGMYGEEIKLDEIESIKLINEMPKVKIRTNGFSFGNINKGYYKLENIGSSKLLLHSEKPPYILIAKEDNESIYYNNNDKNSTILDFNKLDSLLTVK